jgi:hypothetical protein
MGAELDHFAHHHLAVYDTQVLDAVNLLAAQGEELDQTFR